MSVATTIEVKSTDTPDEVRQFEGNGQAKIVKIAGRDVNRGTFEPGWKWSENVRPLAKTDSCQAAHLCYCIQGQMTVKMDDGSQIEIKPGDVAAIPPGHDAWVDGTEACELIDFGDLSHFAKA